MALFPIQVALHNGATFNFEENPKSKGNLACPDNGYVVFKVTPLFSRLSFRFYTECWGVLKSTLPTFFSL